MINLDLSRSQIEQIEAVCLLVDIVATSTIKLLVILALLKYLFV